MSFLTETLIFLAAAILVVPLCKRLGLSSVLGYLGAGVLIGPHALGIFTQTRELLHFAEIGVVLLLFLIGLELQPRRLWVMRKAVLHLGSAQMLTSTLVLSGVFYWFVRDSVSAAVLLGFSLALSSTAFVLQLLTEQNRLNHPHGRAAFGVLLFQDVAVIPAIVVLSLLAPIGVDAAAQTSDPSAQFIGWRVALLLAGLGAARLLLRPLLRWIASTGIHELFVAAGLALVIGAALAFQAAGLSMGLGAFVAGMMVADSEYRHQLETDIVPFKGLLLGLFFMAVGSATNLALLSEMPIMMTTLALTLVAIKAFSIYPLARWYGLDHAEALRGAVTLSQSGEFAFVLLTSATAASIISTEMFDTGILLVTLSMITTPLLLKGIESRLHKQSSAQQAVYDSIDEPANPVIIAGFGRVGQIVGRLLTMRHIPFTALEINPAQVDFVRQFGNKIYYGDATRMDLLRTAHIEQAQALVLALDEEEASIRLAETIRETFPHVTIFARARNRHHEMVLRELGVEHVVRETLLSSLAMSRQLLQGLGDSHEKAAESVAHFQAHDNTTFARQMAVFRDDHAFKQTTRQATEELKQLFDADAVNLE